MLARPTRLDIALAFVVLAGAIFESLRITPTWELTASGRWLLPPAICGLALVWRRGPLPLAGFGVLAAVLVDRALGPVWTAIELPYALVGSAAIAIYSIAVYARLAPAVLGTAAAVAAPNVAQQAFMDLDIWVIL